MKYTPLTKEEQMIRKYIHRYPDWISEIETLSDGRQAIKYDTDRVQSFKTADEVYDIALRLIDLQDKVDAVERVLRQMYSKDMLISAMRQAYCYRKWPEDKRQKKIFLQTRSAFYAEVRWVLGDLFPKEEEQ